MHKNAGILKAPDKIVDIIFLHCMALIAEKFIKEIDIELSFLLKRNNQAKIIEKVINDKNYETLYECSNYLNFIDSLDTKSINLIIPNFENKKEQYLFGRLLEEDTPALIMNASKIKNKYNVNYKIMGKQYLDVKNISKQELKNIFEKNHKYYDGLNRIISMFFSFSQDFEQSGVEYLRSLYFKKTSWKKYYNSSEQNPQTYEFPITDFPYMEKNKKDKEFNKKWIFVVKLAFSKDEIDELAKEHNMPNSNFLGFYDNTKDTIAVVFKYNDIVTPDNELIKKLKNTVYHEIQHMMQDIISTSYYDNLKGRQAGLPSKKMRSKDYDIYGNKENSEEEQDHFLIDVEFYTDLKTSLDIFKNEARNIPKQLLDTLFKVCIFNLDKKYVLDKINSFDLTNKLNTYTKNTLSNNMIENTTDVRDFFNMLKNNNELKYFKAVKEFYKEIF